MNLRFLRGASCAIVFAAGLIIPSSSLAQRPPGSGPPAGGRPAPGQNADIFPTASLHVYVRGPDGSPIDQMALVTLFTWTNQMYRQSTTQGGNAEFDSIPPGQYTIQVIAPAYENAKENVEISFGGSTVLISLKPSSTGSPDGASSAPAIPILPPKVQKELNKAIEALRANKPGDAHSLLMDAYRHAPNHPQVNYLFGVYFSQTNDWREAKRSWEKAVSAYPRYLPALLSLGEAMLREGRPSDAASYFKRAVEAEPSSWRAHAHLAEAELRLSSLDEAVHDAERAIELGHSQAVAVQPLLARALGDQGKVERAIKILEAYLQERPSDVDAKKALEALRAPLVVPAKVAVPAADPPQDPPPLPAFASASLLPSAWMPPDIDEKIPPVEPGVACTLDTVLSNASKHALELVGNVDRFTATESLKHELFSTAGLPSTLETRKFNYLVSIEQIRPGILSVEEYRDGSFSYEKFPDGIATLGLPSLVLVFHPAQVSNYDMTCEGLAKLSGGLAWQVHLRQRPDKPRTLRSYRIGAQSYPVSLRGRAWIAADTFQIVRLETDLVAPLPQIHLAGEHTAIEYGPVHFKRKNVDMWLPQSAEVYFDWRGRRIYRRHDFSNYLLFAVDENQKIAPPKTPDAGASGPSAETQKPR